MASLYCQVAANSSIAVWFRLNGVLVNEGGGAAVNNSSVITNLWCTAERIIQVTTANTQLIVIQGNSSLDVFGDQPEGTSIQILKLA
ncbi:hypothetical protein A7K91_20510 [Paenibacillus oryzae]|uniref:Uncharacterized protein n=2 Tax=Paenibacillus oryzae TaxID=1844972 RepID=A0A1A5YEK7_9BACL|nr:hypothetical protein A7K91_20510 [Paenibacillus oryzae]